MQSFWEWLFSEERVSRSVLQSYDAAFRQALQGLIQRIDNPTLRARFREMMDCPIKDSRGHCQGFAEYIVGALVKNGIHNLYDLESSLAYVVGKMLMDRGEAGEPRTTVFSGFEERPDYVEGNPLQARFMKYLQFAVNNIRKGKIPRLANVERRPQGTVSIAHGRQRKGDPTLGISSDEIAARPPSDADLNDLIDGITALLRRQESAYGLPLTDVFKSILGGMNTEEQRELFGDRRARVARQVISQTIKDYASATENYALLRLLNRPSSPKSPTPVRLRLPDKERDYASIIHVLDKFDRPVGTADLGRFRRRWLEYAPRNPASGYRNRLEEVLDLMVREGVLKATRTAKGAVVYTPGEHYEQYRQPLAV